LFASLSLLVSHQSTHQDVTLETPVWNFGFFTRPGLSTIFFILSVFHSFTEGIATSLIAIHSSSTLLPQPHQVDTCKDCDVFFLAFPFLARGVAISEAICIC